MPADVSGGTALKLTAKDFRSDQEVRWCPGCGDYAILASVQSVMAEIGIPRERIVFVSGIGCASRFPYYMQTYGMHSIHGRPLAIAIGAEGTFVARAIDTDRKHVMEVLHRAAAHRGAAFVEIFQNCNI